MNANEEPKIYLLPNLMTAGNLFCGFAAILRIIEAALVIQQGGSAVVLYHQALTFVLGACLFDLLDGRPLVSEGAKVLSVGSLIHWPMWSPLE